MKGSFMDAFKPCVYARVSYEREGKETTVEGLVESCDGKEVKIICEQDGSIKWSLVVIKKEEIKKTTLI